MENVTKANGLYRFNDLVNFFDDNDLYIVKAIRDYIIETGIVPKECYVSDENMNYFRNEFMSHEIILDIHDNNKSHFKAEKIPGDMLNIRLKVNPDSISNEGLIKSLKNNEVYFK